MPPLASRLSVRTFTSEAGSTLSVEDVEERQHRASVLARADEVAVA